MDLSARIASVEETNEVLDSYLSTLLAAAEQDQQSLKMRDTLNKLDRMSNKIREFSVRSENILGQAQQVDTFLEKIKILPEKLKKQGIEFKSYLRKAIEDSSSKQKSTGYVTTGVVFGIVISIFIFIYIKLSKTIDKGRNRIL